MVSEAEDGVRNESEIVSEFPDQSNWYFSSKSPNSSERRLRSTSEDSSCILPAVPPTVEGDRHHHQQVTKGCY